MSINHATVLEYEARQAANEAISDKILFGKDRNIVSDIAIGLTPAGIVHDALDVGYGVKDVLDGNIKSGLLMAGAGLLGAVPLVGDAAKTLIKGGGKAVGEGAQQLLKEETQQLAQEGAQAAAAKGGANTASEAGQTAVEKTKNVPPAQEGDKVYRVWGDESGPNGRSWTRENPNNINGYRNEAGLPPQNSGRFVSEGTLVDTKGVTTKPADPIGTNRGGLDEVLVPQPEKQIKLERVSGVNPEF